MRRYGFPCRFGTSIRNGQGGHSTALGPMIIYCGRRPQSQSRVRKEITHVRLYSPGHGLFPWNCGLSDCRRLNCATCDGGSARLKVRDDSGSTTEINENIFKMNNIFSIVMISSAATFKNLGTGNIRLDPVRQSSVVMLRPNWLSEVMRLPHSCRVNPAVMMTTWSKTLKDGVSTRKLWPPHKLEKYCCYPLLQC